MWRRPIASVRERMVLGQVRPVLEADECVAVWAHVLGPVDGRPGLLSLTSTRCLVHFTTRTDATASLAWESVTAWRIGPAETGGAVMSLHGAGTTLEVRLPLTTTARAERATDVVEHLARLAPDAATESRPALPLRAEPRRLRDHARRVAVTFAGVLVMLLGIVFSSPFVPGPGALTFVAGLAILAREYDWARDAHRWVKRRVERVLAELWRRRGERRARRAARVTSLDSARSGVGDAAESAADVTPSTRAG